MYSVILPKCHPIVQQNANINWINSWKNVHFRYINIHEREIAFKFLHNILPYRLKLYKMKRADSPLCELCEINEDKTHMFIECIKVGSLLAFFKTKLKAVCNINNIDDVGLDKILHLDFNEISKKDRHAAILLTTAYISTVWFNRDLRTSITLSSYKSTIMKHKYLMSLVLDSKMTEVFSTKYCNIEESL